LPFVEVLVVVLAGALVDVVDFPPHQLCFGLVVAGGVDEGVVVVVVFSFFGVVVFGTLHVQVGDAVPSLHI
jgi:hypothetical protein